MQLTFNIPDLNNLRKIITKRNIIIAGVVATGLITGKVFWDRHRNQEALLACETAVEARADARRLMVKSSFDMFSHGVGMAVVASDAGELYERANDMVRKCERDGVL